MNITEYTIEKLEDPTGILTGDRYEFILHLELPEDDELNSENGVYVKAIYSVVQEHGRLLQYHLVEDISHNVLDFALEEDEEQLIADFCFNHYQEAE
ncbi:DUF6509 family protein [Falsibacillus albus]|uniref:Pullulanase n=1 Tax=Falsibacillus albus TaxID=2478915 RepID=A0A3L7JZG6_9BACI|nr:DUF6509 family protein [Falsibacillus albus]RLQ96116.1 pullulanase [Falsibacillus albus]